jgi:hypothetical protein
MFEIDDHNDADSDGNRCETKNLMLTQTATDQGQCASDWLKWIVFVDFGVMVPMIMNTHHSLPATDVTFNDTTEMVSKTDMLLLQVKVVKLKVTIPEDIKVVCQIIK